MREDYIMNDYWLTKAAEAEAELDALRSEMEETYRNLMHRIQELEQALIKANNFATMNSIQKD